MVAEGVTLEDAEKSLFTSSEHLWNIYNSIKRLDCLLRCKGRGNTGTIWCQRGYLYSYSY